MANASNRNVSLTISANTVGVDKIKQLGKELSEMAKKGGTSAPEIKKLSDELETLSNQQDLLSSLNKVESELTQVASTATSTKTSFKALEAELKTVNGSFKSIAKEEAAAKASLDSLNSALTASKQNYLQAKANIDALRGSVTDWRKATAEQKAALDTAKSALTGYKAEVSQLKASVAGASAAHAPLLAALKSAQAELAKKTSEMNKAKSASDNAAKAERDLATEITRLKGALTAAGVDVTNLAAAEAKAAAQAVDLTNKIEALKARFAAIGPAAKTAGSAIDNAFGVVGVRSTAAIKAEMAKIDVALRIIAHDAKATGADFDRAFMAAQVRLKALEAELLATGGATVAAGKSAGGLMMAFSKASRAMAGLFVAKQIYDVNAALDSAERTLRIVAGSANAAAKEMEFVKQVAQRTGTDISSAAQSYAALAAATRGTALEGKQTREVFEAVSRSMSILGKSSYETEYALKALQQMVSKGVVSMEEFRQQLAERLPGAMPAVAKALGLTTAQFNDLIASGQLTAEEVLPAVAVALNEIYGSTGEVESMSASWGRLTTQFKLFLDAIVYNDAAMAVVDLFADVFGVLGQNITAAGASMGRFFGILGRLKVSVFGASDSVENLKASLDMARAADKAGLSIEEYTKQISDQDQTMKGSTNTIVDNTKAMIALKLANSEVTGTIKSLTKEIEVQEAAMVKADKTIKAALASTGESYKQLTDVVNDEFAKQIAAVNQRADEESRINDTANISDESRAARATQIVTESVNKQTAIVKLATAEKIKLIEEEGRIQLETNAKMEASDYERKLNGVKIEAEILANKRAANNEALTSYKALIAQLNATAQQHYEKVKSLEEEKKRLYMSSEELIRSLKQSGLTDMQAYADKQLQIDEYRAKSKAELEKGNYTLAKEYAQKSIDLAASTANEISDKDTVVLSKQSAVNEAIKDVTESTGLLAKAIDAEKSSHQSKGDAAVSAASKTKSAITDVEKEIASLNQTIGKMSEINIIINRKDFVAALDEFEQAIKTKQFLLGVKGNLEELQAQITEFAANKKNGVEVQVVVDKAKAQLTELKTFAEQNNKYKLEVGIDSAIAAVNKAGTAIKSLNQIKTDSSHKVASNIPQVAAQIQSLNNKNTSSTHTVYQRTVQGHAAGGLIEGYNRVRNLVRGPGTSTSDSVNAKLSAGEYVVKASSVSRFGIDFMNAINAGVLPLKGVLGSTPSASFANGTQRLAGGGPVMSTSNEEITLKLDLGGKQFPVRSSRDTAKGLSDALRQIARGR
jgi:tape measure domain-containing protein